MSLRLSIASLYTLGALASAMSAARADSVYPVVKLTVPVTITNLPAPATGVAPKAVLGCALATGSVIARNIPANTTIVDNAFDSGPASNNLPGKLLSQSYTPIALDATGSYTGSMTVTLTADSLPDLRAASGYACRIFTTAPYFAALVNGTGTFATFQPSVFGTL